MWKIFVILAFASTPVTAEPLSDIAIQTSANLTLGSGHMSSGTAVGVVSRMEGSLVGLMLARRPGTRLRDHFALEFGGGGQDRDADLFDSESNGLRPWLAFRLEVTARLVVAAGQDIELFVRPGVMTGNESARNAQLEGSAYAAWFSTVGGRIGGTFIELGAGTTGYVVLDVGRRVRDSLIFRDIGVRIDRVGNYGGDVSHVSARLYIGMH